MDWKWYLLSFQGRIGRKQYWSFVGVLLVAYLVVGFVSRDSVILPLILSLLALWPSLAVAAKRWHDRDKSAWWILIGIIPIIGPIWALVENGFLRGTPAPNRFGPDPLEPAAQAPSA